MKMLPGLLRDLPCVFLPVFFIGCGFCPGFRFFPAFFFCGFCDYRRFLFFIPVFFSPFFDENEIFGTFNFGSLIDPLIKRTRTASAMTTSTKKIAGKSKRTRTNPAIRITTNSKIRRTESFMYYTPWKTGMLKNIATIYGATIYTIPVIIVKMLAKK